MKKKRVWGKNLILLQADSSLFCAWLPMTINNSSFRFLTALHFVTNDHNQILKTDSSLHCVTFGMTRLTD
jgi:hypothetical protein